MRPPRRGHGNRTSRESRAAWSVGAASRSRNSPRAGIAHFLDRRVARHRSQREQGSRARGAHNSGFEFPAGRITVNLSPADLPKEGCRYDLPIALGILLASCSSKSPSNAWRRSEFYGELGLAGELRPVKGVLLAAAHAAREGRNVVVPAANLHEARFAEPSRTRGADTLLGVCALGARPFVRRGCRWR